MGAQAVRLTNVDIDNALKNNHFEVIFQPIFQLSDGALLRMETFVRWVHPGLGVLPPGAFISFFENQGRMSELTRYVLTTALARYKEWRGDKGPGFSINLSHSDLVDESFPKWLEEVLAANDFPPSLLTLECPNPPADMEAELASGAFSALQKTGVNLAIEVRGRANDFLRDVSPFPFVEVKTGGSAILRFARTVRGGPGLTAISELLELAKANNARTVAVGVEDQASLHALASLGFEAAQGNYLAGVGDIKSFAMTTINDVRQSLSLDPLSQDDLVAQVDGAVAEPVADTVPETEAVADADTPEIQDEPAKKMLETREEKLRAVKLKALQKKKAAQLAAKQRAVKKAAEAKANAEKAQAELEAKHKALAEAEAARAAEENARKLQDRLSSAFEPEDAPAAEATPQEDDTAKAGLLLGGSLAASALGHTPPAPAEEETEEPAPETVETAAEAAAEPAVPETEGFADEAEAEIDDEPVLLKEEEDDPILIPEDDPIEASAAQAEESEEDEPVALDNDLLQKSYSSGLTLMGIQKTPAGAAQEKPAEDEVVEEDVTTGTAKLDQFELPDEQEIELEELSPEQDFAVEIGEDEEFPESATGNAVTGDPVTASAEPLMEIAEETIADDFRSEDEVLDEAFAGAAELDPTDHHPETEDDDLLVLDSSEAGFAQKLAQPRRTRRKKNFLQRKYKIMPTHFWPRSWKRKWDAKRAERDAMRDDEFDDLNENASL
jgi:EAL domain-containing protein (putative c-di-GMP-specific phosphodiesterase class I)